MNQILESKVLNKSTSLTPTNSSKKFKFILIFSILIIALCIIIYLILKYNSYKKEKISKSLVTNFGITTLYANNNNYIATKTTNNIEEPFVIGLLKIDKINLMYPILSNTSEELLKISPCRFYGPMPNEVGNLCIAGHNYANQKHFGKLTSLEINDIFQVYDLNGNSVNYIIYEIKEVPANDTSCINQNTNNLREVTLITCNTIKGTRITVKAKENR